MEGEYVGHRRNDTRVASSRRSGHTRKERGSAVGEKKNSVDISKEGPIVGGNGDRARGGEGFPIDGGPPYLPLLRSLGKKDQEKKKKLDSTRRGGTTVKIIQEFQAKGTPSDL